MDKYNFDIHEKLNVTNMICEEFMSDGYSVSVENGAITIFRHAAPTAKFVLCDDMVGLTRHDAWDLFLIDRVHRQCIAANIYDGDAFGALLERAKVCANRHDCAECPFKSR